MKLASTHIAIKAALIVALAVGTLGLGRVHASLPPRTTWGGDFGYIGQGYVNGVGQNAAIGIYHFDGHGNLTGNYTGSYAGTQVVHTFTGTYTINPDSSGHLQFVDDSGNSESLDMVLVSSGNKVLLVDKGTGNIDDGTLERQ